MDNNLISLFNDLKSRGVISNFANAESFFSLKENKKTIYLGIDCTADSLHIGHLFPLIQTVRFAKEGFKVLIILGEATSKIGDPSDKLKERPQLDETEIKNYSTRIREQLQSLLIKEPCEKFIDEIDFLPLERFYSKNLLKQIYSVLGIKEEDKKAVK
jgi:tyrosyl-tRNA synthetase